MSNWTDEKHDEARSIGFGFSFYEPGISELVADAVTEIERLRAEADAPAPDPGVEFAEWVMEFVPSDRQDEAWREFTRSKVRVCLGDHKTESQLREEIETFKRGMADRASEDQR